MILFTAGAGRGNRGEPENQVPTKCVSTTCKQVWPARPRVKEIFEKSISKQL